MAIEKFDAVLESIRKNPSRNFHLLIGNGFSMAYDPKIFSYNALHDFVLKLHNDDLSTILNVVETKNFELIMQQLDTFLAVAKAFGAEAVLIDRLERAGQTLKNSLLEAVKALHPEHVFTIPSEKSKKCSSFLKTFLDTKGKLFSTNYDLLLYWVLMRNEVIGHCDGFGRELVNAEDRPAPEEQVWSDLIWGVNRDEQNVFYLHGALPFFDKGYEVAKEVYDAYNYLLENINARMDRGEYPIFVTAGDGRQKLTHILHNQYLTYCYEKLCTITGSLVTFGFNFGEYDEHIIDAINRAAMHGRKVFPKLNSIYIGVYSKDDQSRIEKLSSRFLCKVHIYDAKTAHVWD